MQEPVEFSSKIAPACLPTADNDYGNKYKKSYYATKIHMYEKCMYVHYIVRILSFLHKLNL